MSVRKRALDLLFSTCDGTNSVEIVGELLNYLVVADFSMREELTLKIAILAERFAPDVKWYVDVSMDLIERAGEFVSEDIWHRVIQLVTNNEGMREYAVNKVVESLQRGGSHEVREGSKCNWYLVAYSNALGCVRVAGVRSCVSFGCL